MMEIDLEQRKKDLQELISKFIKGINLSKYQQQIDSAFAELDKIENTRKKWL